MRTPPPIEPGTPTAHSNPVSPADAVRRATTGMLAPPPARTVTPSMSMWANCSPRISAIPANPASAISRFDPLPITSTGTAVARTASPTTRQIVVGLGPHQQRGAAADAVRGELTDRFVPSRSGAQDLARQIERVGHAACPRRNRSCNSSGSEVRSPAPRVRHRSPGRSSDRRKVVMSARCGK